MPAQAPHMLVKVQREDFDVGAELEALTRGRPGVGGMASFLGLVRDIHGDARVGAMTLEHFPGMTERELQRISAEAHARWPLEGTLVVHRHGRLELGDRIVLCAAASAHRQAAFDACVLEVDALAEYFRALADFRAALARDGRRPATTRR